MDQERTFDFPCDGWQYGMILKLSVYIYNNSALLQQKLNVALLKIAQLEQHQKVHALQSLQSQRAREYAHNQGNQHNQLPEQDKERRLALLEELVINNLSAKRHNHSDSDDDDYDMEPDTCTIRNWETIQSDAEIENLILRIQAQHGQGPLTQQSKDSIDALRLALHAAIKFEQPWSDMPPYRGLLKNLLNTVRLNLGAKSFTTAEKIRENLAVKKDDRLSKLLANPKFNPKHDRRDDARKNDKKRFCTHCRQQGHTAEFCFKNPEGKNYRGGKDAKKL